MAAVSKTAKPSAPVVVGRFRSTKTGILPFGFRVLINHGSFCLLVLIAMCSTLAVEVVSDHAQVRRADSCLLVCNFVPVDALQLLEMNRDLLSVGGTFGVEDKRGLGGGRHLPVD
jgi:hypothetical protein